LYERLPWDVVNQLVHANGIQTLNVDMRRAKKEGSQYGQEDGFPTAIFVIYSLVCSQTSPNLAVKVEKPSARWITSMISSA